MCSCRQIIQQFSSTCSCLCFWDLWVNKDKQIKHVGFKVQVKVSEEIRLYLQPVVCFVQTSAPMMEISGWVVCNLLLDEIFSWATRHKVMLGQCSSPSSGDALHTSMGRFKPVRDGVSVSTHYMQSVNINFGLHWKLALGTNTLWRQCSLSTHTHTVVSQYFVFDIKLTKNLWNTSWFLYFVESQK